VGVHIGVIMFVMMLCHGAPPSGFFAIILYFIPHRNPDGGIFVRNPLTNPYFSVIMLNWNIRDENCSVLY
jgi:hypothetical protein